MDRGVELIRTLPIWSGEIEIWPLSGGLSNANYKVLDRNRSFMVRVGSDLPFHHVSREREAAISRAAHASHLSPAVIHDAPGVMVFEFIEGRTFGAHDIRDNISSVLPLIRACHGQLATQLTGPAPFFWVFHVIRDYAATLRTGGSRMVAALPHFLGISARLEAAQLPMPMVFGHNDLLPANIIDDGKRLWLIDWEYGGYGSPLFDLANLSSNAGFGDAEARALLSAYFGRDTDEPLWIAFQAMKTASLLREAMWSMVSELHMNAPGVDYVAYTSENLARFERAHEDFEDMVQ